MIIPKLYFCEAFLLHYFSFHSVLRNKFLRFRKRIIRFLLAAAGGSNVAPAETTAVSFIAQVAPAAGGESTISQPRQTDGIQVKRPEREADVHVYFRMLQQSWA